MAFIIRKGKHSARLIRRSWVQKDEANGIPHGYVEESCLGSLPLTAKEWPSDLGKKRSKKPVAAGVELRKVDALTPDEKEKVRREVFDVASRHEKSLELEAAEKAADPTWRIREATKWLTEAAPLCQRRPLDGESFGELLAVLGSLKSSRAGAGEGSKGDPLEALIHAAEVAAAAVSGGHYGTRPTDGPMKDTPVNSLWSRVRAAVAGPQSGSLMRALQDADWVAKR